MKKIKYKCDTCGLVFIDTDKKGVTCPQCDADIFSNIVDLGLMYLAGESLGLIGDDDEDKTTTTDLDTSMDFEEELDEDLESGIEDDFDFDDDFDDTDNDFGFDEEDEF